MSNKFLDPVVRFHFRFFQFLSLQSISLDLNAERKQRTELLLRIVSISWIVGFSTLMLHTLRNDDEFLYMDDAFGYFNDVLKVTIAYLAVTVSFLEAILRREDQRTFWRLYISCQQQKISKDSKTTLENLTPKNRLCFWREQFSTHLWFLAIFYGLLAAEICAQLIFYFGSGNISRHLLLFWFMFTPYSLTVRFRNLQCIFHMECMRLELQQLAHELRLLAELTTFGQRVKVFKGFDEFVRRKLILLQMNYECIYKMFSSYQKSFGYSTIFILLIGYVRVLVDSYFLYYSLYLGKESIKGALLIPALFEVPVILLTSRNCMNAVKDVTYQLHCIKHSVYRPQLSVQIQNFSLQVLHQKIVIDAVGISVMDGYMLSNAIGSIITYMVFFVQFMPTFKKR